MCRIYNERTRKNQYIQDICFAIDEQSEDICVRLIHTVFSAYEELLFLLAQVLFAAMVISYTAAYVFLVLLLVIAAVIDAKTTELSDDILLCILALGLIIGFKGEHPYAAIISGVLAVLYDIIVGDSDALGGADVLASLALIPVFGFYPWLLWVIVSCLLGLLWAGIETLLNKVKERTEGKSGAKRGIPFLPAMASGFVLVSLAVQQNFLL